jgi:pyruvate formate lyase activating enzyme
VDAALASGSPSLAFTYSEPSIHIEYLLEAAGLARQAGLATVLVTNGSLLPGPADDLVALMDAVNVDLKAWSDAAYREILRGDRGTVLSFIEAASTACHLEVTTLIVPGISDGTEAIQGIASFLGALDRGIPLHLSAYHPDWRWDKAGLPQARLAALAALARESLDYVYLGNTGGLEESLCPACGGLLASRRGYQTRIGCLVAASPLPERPARAPGAALCTARCSSCGADLPFVLAAPRRI